MKVIRQLWAKEEEEHQTCFLIFFPILSCYHTSKFVSVSSISYGYDPFVSDNIAIFPAKQK